MDKLVLNGNKQRFYSSGNDESGSIQYTDSRLRIRGNNSGSGVLLSDGKLYFKNGDSKSSIIYNPNYPGVTITDGLLIIKNGSNTSSFTVNSNGLSIDSATQFNSYINALGGVYSSLFLRNQGNVALYTINNDIVFQQTGDSIMIGAFNQNNVMSTQIGSGVWDTLNIYANTTLQDYFHSPTYASGFAGTGFAISKSSQGKYIAQFDDLWVRGSINVNEFVINQIRATNGSLWVSDAAKSTNATYSSGNKSLVLTFQTGSILPFIAGDIIRSKRWSTSGSTTTSVWDLTSTISGVTYVGVHGYVTISAPDSADGIFVITSSANGSWSNFTTMINVSGSQWVRVGNTGSNVNRQGAIYLTSNDLGGPYLDVIDGVSRSSQAVTTTNNIKLRLGNLNNISLGGFSNMSGYGLYADNVFLRGTILATAGTFSGNVFAQTGYIGGSSGWTISSGLLTTSGIQLLAGSSPAIKIGAASYGDSGIWMGRGSTSYSMSVWNNNKGIKWDGTNLELRGTNFTLASTGNLSASNATFSGVIQANSGYLGGWTISSGGIYNTHSYGSVVITKSGLSSLTLTDINGNFTYSGANTSLFNNITNKYLSNYSNILQSDTYTTYSLVTTSVASPDIGVGFKINTPDNTIHQFATFTLSGLTPHKQYTLQTNLTGISIPGLGTSVGFKNPSLIWFDFYSSTSFGGAPIITTILNPIYDINSSMNSILKEYKILSPSTKLYAVGRYSFRFTDNATHPVTFTYSGYRIDEFKQYTQLSQKGLLVFNSPSNYLQLSSQNNGTTVSSKGSISELHTSTISVNKLNCFDPLFSNTPVFVSYYTESTSTAINITSEQLLTIAGITGYQIILPISVTINQLLSDRVDDVGLVSTITHYTTSNKYYASSEIIVPNPNSTYSIGYVFRVQ